MDVPSALVTFEIHPKPLAMKKIVVLLFVGLLSWSVSAQEKTAKIEFKTETVDYGEIAKGSDGVRVFEFTNTGNMPLIPFLRNRKRLFSLVKPGRFR